MHLIPTHRKEKLPRGFSYPLGAEGISAALDGVPQFDNIDLCFSWRDEFWTSRWQQRLQARGVVTLLAISYSTYSGRWDLYVYSVPSQYSQVARESLKAELPGIRQQLMTIRTASKISVKLDLAAIGPAVNQEVHRTVAPSSAAKSVQHYGSRSLRRYHPSAPAADAGR
jgi:hypothetical protein